MIKVIDNNGQKGFNLGDLEVGKFFKAKYSLTIDYYYGIKIEQTADQTCKCLLLQKNGTFDIAYMRDDRCVEPIENVNIVIQPDN